MANVNKITMKLTNNKQGITVRVGDKYYMSGVCDLIQLLNDEREIVHLSKITPRSGRD